MGTGGLIGILEGFFYRLGKGVATRPFTTMAACLAAVAASTVGLVGFRWESRTADLWMPRSTTFLDHRNWMDHHLPQDSRPDLAIIRGKETVLTAEALLLLLDVHEAVLGVRKEVRGKVYGFEDVCLKIAVNDNDFVLRRESNNGSRDTITDAYCRLVTGLPQKCLVKSILEIWDFDRGAIAGLTDAEIVDAVNTANVSRTYFYEQDYTAYLGAIRRNSSGHVVAAKSTVIYWTGSIDKERGLRDHMGQQDLEQVRGDRAILGWEKEFIRTLKPLRSVVKDRSGGRYKLYFQADRSINQENNKAYKKDTQKVLIGFTLMLLYTVCALGKFDLVEQRVYLTVAGLAAVLLGLVAGISLCQAMGLVFAPIHQILPYLCMGIGIDDMFVIVQCWHNLAAGGANPDESIPERMGKALSHAGAAITVTTLTDFFAFGAGLFTEIPGMRSFCTYCSVCILLVYVFQVTWFVAWFALDQARVEAGLDGCFPCCITHPDRIKGAGSQQGGEEASQVAMGKLADCLENNLVKVVVLAVTAGLLSSSVFALTRIETDFDIMGNVPPSSHVHKAVKLFLNDFPDTGVEAAVYTGPIPYAPEDYFTRLDTITKKMEEWEEQKEVVAELVCWWCDFKLYLRTVRNQTWLDDYQRLPSHLSDFLFSKVGAQHRRNIKFTGTLECGRPAPNIRASQTLFHLIEHGSSTKDNDDRDRLDHVIHQNKILKKTFAFSKKIATLTADKETVPVLVQNMSLAIVAVFLICLLLLGDLRMSILVMSCVVITLLDTLGTLYYWGAYINFHSVIFTVATIGVGVDYPVHIMLAYILAKSEQVQSTKDRVRLALVNMGVPVLNGAATTEVALIVLGFSEINNYTYFFKVFTLMVCFGLFHAILFLPVVLSLMPDGTNQDPNEKSALVPKHGHGGGFQCHDDHGEEEVEGREESFHLPPKYDDDF